MADAAGHHADGVAGLERSLARFLVVAHASQGSVTLDQWELLPEDTQALFAATATQLIRRVALIQAQAEGPQATSPETWGGDSAPVDGSRETTREVLASGDEIGLAVLRGLWEPDA